MTDGMTNLPDFGKAVRKRLIDLDWTVKGLAEQMGYSTAYINEIVRGTRKAPHVRQKICDVLGLESDELLGLR